ncbi:MAG: LemA family protein [Candidatus Anstonellales archaeon]
MVLEIILIVVLAVLVLWLIITYNNLVRLNEAVNNAWAQIDVQLKRRADLIPNLVETVKGYMKHEKTTLTEITKLRSKILEGTPQQRLEANDMLTQALKSIFAVAENYPQLRASENFMQLQQQLTDTENKISVAREDFNNATLTYNREVKVFPTNIAASLFGFKERIYFQATEQEKQPPKVSF